MSVECTGSIDRPPRRDARAIQSGKVRVPSPRVVWAAVFLCLAVGTVVPVSFAYSAEDHATTSGPDALSNVGMQLEAAWLKSPVERRAVAEDLAISMGKLMKDGVPAEKRGAVFYLSGEIRYALGDYAGAGEHFKKSAGAGARDVYADDAALAYITSLEAQGRDTEAAREWAQWQKRYPTSPLLAEALLARAWNALRRDTLSEASALLAQLTTRFPFMADDPRVQLARASAAYADGQFKDAMDILNRVNRNAASYSAVEAPVLYLGALCRQESGDALQAAAQFQEIVELHPESSLRDHAMLAKANIFLVSRAYRSAAEEFAGVIAKASQPAVQAEAELRRAASVVLDGDSGKGTDLLRETVAHYPKTAVAARAQYLLGEVLMSQSKHEDAILEFNRVLSDYFEHSLAASAQYRVGRCLDALGRQSEATGSYMAVVSGYPLSPESPAAAYLAGVGLLAQNKPTAAAPYFQLVLDRYARGDSTGMFVFASAEDQELVEAALCLLELSYRRAGDLGQLSGVPHMMLRKMPPSKSLWRAYAELIDADALAAQARYDEAQQSLNKLVKDFPGNRVGVSANRLLAWTYAQQGRDELALKTEAEMLSHYATQGDTEDLSSAYLNKGHILFNQKKYEEAASVYEEFLQRFPGHAKQQLALYQAGLCYVRLGRSGNAVDKWEAVVLAGPATQIAERAWVRAGDLYFQTDHYDDAKRCYQGLLDNFSNTPVAATATLRMAQCEYNAGNDREALQRFSEVISKFPNSGVAGAAKRGIEQSLYRLGQSENGSAVLAELVETYPTSPFAADAQFEIAMRLYKAKNFGEAAEAFRRVVSQFPGFAAADRAHFLMAEAYAESGSTDNARLAYEQFLMFFPKSELRATARFRLGSLRFVQGDYMQAAVDFTGVLSGEVPKDVASASLYNLALCRRMLGQTEEAKTLLERYRKEHPSGDEREADVAYQLGDVHDKAGQTQLAAEEFTRALSAKPRPDLATELQYRLGLCREVLGDDQSAVAAYKQAMAAQEKGDAFRVSALVHCAGLYEKMGKYDMALSAYRDLIQNAKDAELVGAAKERVAELEAIGR